MAITQNNFTGDGSTVLFSFTFPYLDESHIKVSLNGSDTILYTLANATTIQMNTAPANGVAIRVYRETELVDLNSTFFAGSAIRSQDLNDNFLQSLYLTQETRDITVEASDGNIPDGSIGSSKLADGAISTPKILDAAVTASKMAVNSVATASIQDSAVTTAKIAALAVATASLADDAVTNAKIADTAVNTAQLASSAVTTDKVADSAVTQAKIGTNVLTPRVSEINGGPLAGFRNAIINGNFDIWQRGTSFTLAEFSADRWFSNRLGTTHTATRQPFTVGQTAVPGEPTYFCRTVVTSVAGAANFSNLIQRIEDVRTFAGQQVTFSFWAKADATKNISVEFGQSFGTGGSPSTTVDGLGIAKVSIGTSWQKVTVTTTLPSISGKTLGTDGNSCLVARIWFDAGSSSNSRTNTLGQQSGTFEIAQVQIEAGPVATPFERRPIGTELSLCQRYYETGVVGGATNNDATFASGGLASAIFTFMTEKRVAPTMTARDSAGTDNRFNGVLNLGGGAGQIATTGGIVTFSRVGGWGTDMGATGLASNRFSYKYEASAEL